MPMLPAKLRSPLKWLMWIIVLQLLLGNISAALYAYRLTHFKAEAAEWNIAEANNVFDKTWMLFTGPQYARDTVENHPVFPVRDVTFKTAKGLLIHAWYSTVAGARGTVCLFHGLNSNKAYYEPEAAAFRSYGFNVLMVDFRAHGISEGMQSTIGYDEAEEVMLAFRFARNQGAGLVFLFGGSMGAVTIARAVSHYRLNPDGIILDMPFDGLVDHVRARGGTFGFPRSWFGRPVTAWIGIENGFPAFRHRTSTYAKDITCPVLLQWGRKDHLVKPSETLSVYRSLASRRKKLVVYEAGHTSFLRQSPGKWHEAMRKFLL